MKDIPQEVIDKITKILAHVECKDGNVNEMENASKLLKEITKKYGVTLEEVTSLASDEDKSGVTTESTRFSNNIPKWQVNLATILAEFYSCKIIRRKNRSGAYLLFIGYEMDAFTLKTTFSSFVLKIMNAANQAVEGRSQKRSKINSFYWGCVGALYHKLEEIQAEEQAKRAEDSDSTALVVIKEEKVDEYIDSEYSPKKGKNRKARYTDPKFYDKGYEHGKKMHIGEELPA